MTEFGSVAWPPARSHSTGATRSVRVKSVRMPGRPSSATCSCRGGGRRVRRRDVRSDTRLVRRRASQRAGGALHPDRQRPLDAPRGEAGVHRGGAVRGVPRRAVVRRVVLGHRCAVPRTSPGARRISPPSPTTVPIASRDIADLRLSGRTLCLPASAGGDRANVRTSAR